MKKKGAIIAVIAAVLLIPIPAFLKDGGTVEYNALLYSVRRVHRISHAHEFDRGKDASEKVVKGYDVGWDIELLGFDLYNKVEFVSAEKEELK